MVEKNNQGFIIYKARDTSKYTRKIITNPDTDMENIKSLNPDIEKVMVCKPNAKGKYECKYKKVTKKADEPDNKNEEKKGGKSRKRNMKRKKTLKNLM